MNIDQMLEAAAHLKGTHDFRNFTEITKIQSENYIRTIFEVSIEKIDLYS